MKTTIERYRAAHFDQPGATEAYAGNTFGLQPDVLERHLRIMNDLRTQGGGISTVNKKWLLKQAQDAGRDPKQALQQILRVERIPDPEQRARAYVVASGAPSQALVDEAINLSKAYSTTWASTITEDRLRARDMQAAKSGEQFRFADTPELQRARQEATATRRAIEQALQDKGLTPPPAKSLEEEQQRAQAYARSAADKLEATRPDAPMRDHIEAAWHADQAFQRLNDAGVSTDTISSVQERTDEQQFAARAVDG